MYKNSNSDNYLQDKRLLSVQEAARYLGISARTIYNRICRKSKNPFPFKVKRLGRLRKFDIYDLEKFINSI